MKDFFDSIKSDEAQVDDFYAKAGEKASNEIQAAAVNRDIAAFWEDLALDEKKKSRAAALAKRGAIKNLEGAETVKDAGGFFDK